jgi:hypothetical protein
MDPSRLEVPHVSQVPVTRAMPIAIQPIDGMVSRLASHQRTKPRTVPMAMVSRRRLSASMRLGYAREGALARLGGGFGEGVADGDGGEAEDEGEGDVG